MTDALTRSKIAHVPEEGDDRPTEPPPPHPDPGVVDLLHSAVPRLRSRGVAALGHSACAPCIELLAQYLYDIDVDVLHDAAKALAQIGSPQAVKHLVEVAVAEHAAVARRVVVVFALAEVKGVSDETVAALRGLLSAPDPWLARTARETLVRLMRY